MTICAYVQTLLHSISNHFVNLSEFIWPANEINIIWWHYSILFAARHTYTDLKKKIKQVVTINFNCVKCFHLNCNHISFGNLYLMHCFQSFRLLSHSRIRTSHIVQVDKCIWIRSNFEKTWVCFDVALACRFHQIGNHKLTKN